MLREAIDLQQKQVRKLVKTINKPKSNGAPYVFKAPTGSGKTHMIADFMNEVLGNDETAVFVVSERSKSRLSHQIYADFERYSETEFKNLKPYKITSDTDKKAKCDALLFIPDSYNVYVLPSDLVKVDGKLERGPLLKFFTEMKLKGKSLYLIRDEGHIETKNLINNYGDFFLNKYDVSATPDQLKKGQLPDIEMTEKEAVEACLIKKVHWYEDGSLEDALDRYMSVKARYVNELNMNPCLLIQISNTEKGETQFKNIQNILNRNEYDELKWIAMGTGFDDKGDALGNDKICQLSKEKRDELLKLPNTHIDIIIFKLKLTEGWDIPRACMLYQVRDSNSEVLDDQVVGRVRRNPKLTTFDELDEKTQQLAMESWVYGVKDKNKRESRAISVVDSSITDSVKIKTTALTRPEKAPALDLTNLLKDCSESSETDIFALYKQSKDSSYSIVKKDCCSYIANVSGEEAYNRWYRVMNNLSTIIKETKRFEEDYDSSMFVDNEVSPQHSSVMIESEYSSDIDNWIWKREDDDEDTFFFDSQAEKEWFRILKQLHKNGVVCSARTTTGNTIYLFGKNYTSASEIRFEYYSEGLIHSSYPDYVMQATDGSIHLFEVKSIDKKATSAIDEDEYEEKIENLQKCYLYSSKKTGHTFYIPIRHEGEWTVYVYKEGIERIVEGKDDFIEFMSSEI